MKGISPLLASVLLLAIGFAVAAILNPWIFTLVRGDTETLSNKSESVTGCNPVTIENIYLDFESNTSRVYVLGKGPAEVLSASLLSTKGVEMSLKNSSIFPLSVGTGERKLIEFNLTFKDMPSCANFSKVSIATGCISDVKTKADNC